MPRPLPPDQAPERAPTPGRAAASSTYAPSAAISRSSGASQRTPAHLARQRGHDAKTQAVIERLVRFYQHENSNIHRAAHELAVAGDRRVRRRSRDGAPLHKRRRLERDHLCATARPKPSIWSRRAGADRTSSRGDEILITHLEHHANIVPWQQLAEEKGANLRVAPVDDSGQVKLDDFQRLLNRRTRIVAFSQVSNALGTITPAREMIEIAHRYGAKVLRGRRPVDRPPADRCAGAGRRLVRLFGSQNLRPHRDSACSTARVSC